MTGELLHLLFAVIMISGGGMLIYGWLKERRENKMSIALDTLEQVRNDLEWFTEKTRQGCPVSQAKVHELRKEVLFLLDLINGDDR